MLAAQLLDMGSMCLRHKGMVNHTSGSAQMVEDAVSISLHSFRWVNSIQILCIRPSGSFELGPAEAANMQQNSNKDCKILQDIPPTLQNPSSDSVYFRLRSIPPFANTAKPFQVSSIGRCSTRAQSRLEVCSALRKSSEGKGLKIGLIA